MKYDSEIGLPRHIAFVMDGNGRWATKRLLARSMGHREGVKTLSAIAKAVVERGIRYASFYAFSTENWARPREEVDSLMKLLKDNIGKIADELIDMNVKLKVIGERSHFDQQLISAIEETERRSFGGVRATINIALSYGSRREMVDAVNFAVENGIKVNESRLSDLLYTAGQPDPDLLIRTGGEHRLSNFLLYQCAYTELYFSDTLWPDFDEKELCKILEDYSSRNRRFGKV